MIVYEKCSVPLSCVNYLLFKVQVELKTAEEKAQDAEAEVTNCNKKILVMEQDLDIVTEKLNSSITKVGFPD